MGNIPGKANLPWVQEYRNPETGPNHPGSDGGSVANPMGNCARCGRSVHHEDLDNHRMSTHLSR